MALRIEDKNVHWIYGVTLLLGVAYGMSISLVSLHLDGLGFDKVQIGELAASFALGIVSLAVPVGMLVRRASAKATLLAAVLGYAAAVSAFPFLRAFPAVAADRFADGAFSAGVWVSSETMLLARSHPKHKAFVMSLYAIAMSVGYVVGPIVARVLTAAMPMAYAFVTSGGLAVAAAIMALLALEDLPRALREGAAPKEETKDAPKDARMDEPKDEQAGEEATPASSIEDEVSTGTLLSRIKCSCFATFAYGYFQASVVLFLPLFLIEAKGISRERTVIVPAFFAFGMLLCSNVVGRVGDRVGHLRVMRTLGFVGMLMILGFVLLDAFPLMCGAVFVAGASLASISPVSLALLGAVAPGKELSRANALYNVAYAVGMLVGPPISSLVYARTGGAPMLLHLAALWAIFVAFTWGYAKDDPAHAARWPQRA